MPRNIEMTRKYWKNKWLLAVPFDKGNGFCIMKKEAYAKKLGNIINGKQFAKVTSNRSNKKDVTIKEEERMNQVFKRL